MSGFDVPGNPDAIITKAGALRTEAARFQQVAAGLRSITTDGWTGRAADRFRERFATEPHRWDEAGRGFIQAAAGLEAYAAALILAKAEARAAAADHDRADVVTAQARTAHDNAVRARQAQQRATLPDWANIDVLLAPEPFHDPGQALRDQARQRMATARSTLDRAADAAAHQIRLGCAAAPASRNWLE